MNENVWFKTQVLETNDEIVKLQGKIQDGSTFQILVKECFIDRIPKTNPEMAWLMVEMNGQQQSEVSITLPVATLPYGSKIVVSVFDIKKDD